MGGERGGGQGVVVEEREVEESDGRKRVVEERDERKREVEEESGEERWEGERG